MADFKMPMLCSVERKAVFKLIGEIVGEMDSILC